MLHDLTWLDEFYKNVYNTWFSGKSDNMLMPLLMQQPLLLAAEHAVDSHMEQLR
jgi:anaphase-promoting complex subunit 1